jgi:hypothetical protein
MSCNICNTTGNGTGSSFQQGVLGIDFGPTLSTSCKICKIRCTTLGNGVWFRRIRDRRILRGTHFGRFAIYPTQDLYCLTDMGFVRRSNGLIHNVHHLLKSLPSMGDGVLSCLHADCKNHLLAIRSGYQPPKCTSIHRFHFLRCPRSEGGR